MLDSVAAGSDPSSHETFHRNDASVSRKIPSLPSAMGRQQRYSFKIQNPLSGK
jgi:hypothetical protein